MKKDKTITAAILMDYDDLVAGEEYSAEVLLLDKNGAPLSVKGKEFSDKKVFTPETSGRVFSFDFIFEAGSDFLKNTDFSGDFKITVQKGDLSWKEEIVKKLNPEDIYQKGAFFVWIFLMIQTIP